LIHYVPRDLCQVGPTTVETADGWPRKYMHR